MSEAFKSYTSAVITVGTTQVEAKVGASREFRRQTIIIYNKSPNILFHGPTGVTTGTGIPIAQGEKITVGIGDVGFFLIAAQAGNQVVIQELA